MKQRLAIFVACIALAPAIGAVAHAQERVTPAVGDSPSAELLLEQFDTQSKANPREAVRLAMQALDEGPTRLVRAGPDDDLFVTVATRIHRALGADRALRDAFRREATADAAASLARGDLLRTFVARLDTEPGLEAAMRLAEGAIARGAFAAAACALARVEDHDLLSGRRAEFHARMTATARMALADAPRSAAGDPVSGTLDAAPAGPWIETWSVPITPMGEPLLGPGVEPVAGRELPTAPAAFPALDDSHVYLDEETSVRAFDLASGRMAWSTFVGGNASGLTGAFGADEGPGTAVGIAGGVVVATSAASKGSVVVSCLGARYGDLRWQSPIDSPDARAGAEPLLPAGMPLIVDGMAIIGARRTTARLETVSWIVATDLDRPGEPAWSTLLASTGSVRMAQGRSADSPVASGGVIVVATATGAVAAIEAIDGSVRWLRRIPVPVREALASSGGAASIAGPAVVRGRVFAITPDRASVRSYDLRSGEILSDVPTGVDSPFGLPEYLVADDAGDVVLAVGDRIAAIDPGNPSVARWTLRTGELPVVARPRGRVGLLRVAGGATLVAMPDSADLVFLDAGNGREAGRIPGAGASNVVARGRQVVGVGAFRVRSWMPAGDAERSAREALARGPGVEDAFPLLQLGRQMRSAALVAEAAEESLRRASAAEAEVGAREDLWAIMRSIDVLDLGTGELRARIDGLVDRSARVAGVGGEGALVRMDRQLRRRAPVEAARLAVEATVGAEPGSTVGDGPARTAMVTSARRRIDAAAALDPAGTTAAVDRAIEGALAARGSPGPQRTQVLRAGAMLCGDTAVGRRCIDELAAAGEGAWLRTARMALLARSEVGPRSITARHTRVDGPAVSFSAAVIPTQAGVSHPPGALVTSASGSLELRRAPSFVPAWRAPVAMEAPMLVASGADLVVADADLGGTGAVACITLDGGIRWSVPGPDRVVTEPEGDLFNNGDRAPVLAPTTFAAPGEVIVTVAPDGSAVGRRRSDGVVAWSLDPADGRVLAIAHAGPILAVLSEPPDGPGLEGRLTVVDAATGVPLRTESVPGGDRARWMKMNDAGIVAIGTADGLRAYGPAVAEGPVWTIDALEVQDAPRAWFVKGWLVVHDRFEEPVAIDAWTGLPSATAFRELAPPTVSGTDALVTVVVAGGWVAFLHEGHVAFFSESGAFSGRDAAMPDRSYVTCAAVGDHALILDANSGEAGSGPLRYSALLRTFDVARGGAAASAPLRVRSLGRPISSIIANEGCVALGNGSSTQVIRVAP